MNRIELQREGHIGVLDYTIDAEGTLSIWHVEVPVAMRGKGLAGELMEKARALAGEHQLRLNPICSFAKRYLVKAKGL